MFFLTLKFYIMFIPKKSRKDVAKEDSFSVEVFKSKEDNNIYYKSSVGELIKLNNAEFDDLRPVFNDLSTNSTSSATTTILEYGINVITTSSTTNYACKLPQPKTGRSLVVVNNSLLPIYLYPSNVGGQINNYAIDVPAVIPPDGKSYTFTCTENPLPGEWTWLPPAINQIVLGDFSIAHTNGVATNRYGVTQTGLGASSGSAVVGGNVSLTGEWGSENALTTVSRIKTYTNIVAADLPSVTNLQVTLITTYKTGASTITSGQRDTLQFRGDGFYEELTNGVGTLTANPNEAIGDTATLYGIHVTPVSILNNQIGIGGAFSNYYYTIGFFIPSTAATKTYKFRVILEYF